MLLRPCVAAAVRPQGTEAGTFEETHRIVRLDGLVVRFMAFTSGRRRHTPGLLRTANPEAVRIFLPLSGSVDVSHAGSETTCPANSLYVLSTSHPVGVRAAGRDSELHACVALEIPRARLPLPRGGVARPAVRLLPADRGYGALLAQILRQLAHEADTYRPADGPRLSAIITGVASALFCAAFENDPEAGSGPEILLLRIKDFITRNLHDVDLAPAVVASAHHISLSYLHRLFQQDGTSVAGWIRSRRLEHARRDLAERVSAALSIRDIATRWGFRHQAHFSRAFREAYGCAPREFRHEERRRSEFEQVLRTT
ncbi:AraC family transcriptional regulator [Kitasatospora sp. NPDC059673]|uniref:AraC family transcriptional regulator n=1 Tax=Kitasatospora sp. NPDC059673 TaxID=3346901 RepID=UPI0036B540BC